MDESETDTYRLAQAARTLRLVNFRSIQLRHTNDQVLGALQDLLAQARVIAQTRPTPDGAAARLPNCEDPTS